tara:strand:- start:22221 stop:22517 length:297 start_codon:yes stop_codon:yes gene_type:complete
MKKKIFEKYVIEVSKQFAIDPSSIFTKDKRRDIADARHLLYYLCFVRPMSKVYIQEYMSDNGYDINHSSIIHGIKVVEGKLKKDQDYISAVKKIKNEI